MGYISVLNIESNTLDSIWMPRGNGFSYTNPGRAWTIHESCPHTIVRSGRPELTTMQLELSPSFERQQQNQPPIPPINNLRVQSLGHVPVQAKSPQCRSPAAQNHRTGDSVGVERGKGEGAREGSASLRPIKPVRTSFEPHCDPRGVAALGGGNGVGLASFGLYITSTTPCDNW